MMGKGQKDGTTLHKSGRKMNSGVKEYLEGVKDDYDITHCRQSAGEIG